MSAQRVVNIAASLLVAVGCAPVTPSGAGPEHRRTVQPTADTVTVRVHEGTELVAALAPDNRQYALIILGQVFVGSRDSAVARPLVDVTTDPGDANFISWSPDSKRLVVRNASGLSTVDLETRAVRQVTRWTNQWFPAWTSDGTGILTTSQVGDSVVVTIHAPDGRSAAIRRRAIPGPLIYADFSPDRQALALTASLPPVNGEPRTELREVDLTTGSIRGIGALQGAATFLAYSPDGEWIAIVVERAAERQLAIVARANGEVRALTTHAEDVYDAKPSWTADSRAVLFTAAGRMHLVARNATDGAGEVVPFAADLRAVRWRGLRRPEIPQPGAIRPVRGILHPEISPNGRLVAYSALGDLWVSDLDAGRPSRITRTANDEESQPRWSPDGSRLAYVVAAPGRAREVRIVRIDTRQTLHRFAINPTEFAWAANGARLAFIAQGAVWWVDIATGVQRAVTPVRDSWATLVGWNRSGDSIVYSAGNGTTDTLGVFRIERLVLQVSTADSGRLDTLGTIPAQYAVSSGWTPNRTHAAYQQAGRGFRLRLGAQPVPIADPAPQAFSWSHDGRVLLYQSEGRLRALTSSSGETRTVNLDQTYRVAVAPPPLLIRNVRIIDGRGAAATLPMDVVVTNGRIATIAPTEGQRAATSAREVDGTGLLLLPGLIDMHAHFNKQVPSAAFLYHGVLSARDAMTLEDRMLMRREWMQTGEPLGPRIFYTGGTVMANAGWGIEQINAQGRSEVDPDDATSLTDVMNRLVALGSASHKVHERDAPLNAKAVRAAHAAGLPVTSHYATAGIFAQGLEGKEHAELFYRDRTAVWRDDVVSLARASGTCVTPTLAWDAVINMRFRSDIFPVDTSYLREVSTSLVDPQDSAFLRQLVQQVRNPRSQRLWERRFQADLESVKRLRNAQVRLTAGTDAGLPGRSLQIELQLLVLAGLTPLEAIRAATFDAASCLGVEDQLSSVAPGMIADLILAGGDPARDIRAVSDVRMIIRGGRTITRAEILRIAQP